MVPPGIKGLSIDSHRKAAGLFQFNFVQSSLSKRAGNNETLFVEPIKIVIDCQFRSNNSITNVSFIV